MADTAVPNNPTAKAFAITSAFWFAFGTSIGMIAAGYLIAPDFMGNISFLQFGRLRPIHVNVVLFGFTTPGLLAAAFYYVPRLLKTELYSQRLGVTNALVWNVAVIAGITGLFTGHSQGREYAELIWPADMLVVVSFALAFINLVLTIRQRKEAVLYVSVWYVSAAVILTGLTYCLGNVIWQPDTGALVGIPDAILLWF
ncbi:MAG: cbb3-type cytochrome c oxidase subunit I, partial [Desulfobacterales bacterium]